MKEQVMIYEVKNSASSNALELLSNNSKYFYWNDTKFVNLDIGDFVFVVNRTGKWVFFTKLDKINIPVTEDGDTTFFNDEGQDYTVSGKWNKFIRLSVIKTLDIHDSWQWKSLGSSETTYLNGSRVDSTNNNRVTNINQLLELSVNEEITNILSACLENFNSSNLKLEIVEALSSNEIQEALHETDFHFKLAQDKFIEFINYNISNIFICKKLLDDFSNTNKSFIDFFNSIEEHNEEHNILKLIGELVSYCDLNAANKHIFNSYEDKRTLAKSFVRQTDWVKSLINFKINKNDFSILPSSINNALSYLKDPKSEITMLSENHREMVSRFLFKQNSYKKETFVKDVIEFFKPYEIEPKNEINLTRIISNILYRYPKVKKLWFEKVEGLAVLDSTQWQDNAIRDLNQKSKIVFWWHRSPTNRAKVDKLLKETIEEKRYFNIYYCAKNEAIYRARVIDFSYSEEYPEKKWNKNEDVAWFDNDFSEYTDDSGKSATIVFLVDEFVKLKNPIPFENFQFFESQPPKRINLQPYSDVEDNNDSKLLNNMSYKELLQHAHNYIRNLGFKYQFEEIANFYLALRAKPFVILAGISGTGKTQLPRRFAEALGFNLTEQIIQIPVRPDWTDSSDLLGYNSLDNKFIPKALTLAIKKALTNTEKPYFFILDEMNLAKVEHYFSDFLSVIETRKWNDTKTEIFTDDIIRPELVNGATNSNDYLGLKLPQNLFLIGTVNMDETTHAFSRKVLDRANSIEMNEVDLDWITTASENISPLQDISNDYFKTLYISSIDLNEEDKKLISNEMKTLNEVNKILENADLHFAYRVRNEIAFYLTINQKNKIIDNNIAFDFQLVQKVLPRIHGSSERIQKVLVELFNLLEGTDFRSDNFEFSMFENKVDHKNLKYKRASKKIIFMLKRFDDDRFTSFWL
jgi:hypothetical protein